MRTTFTRIIIALFFTALFALTAKYANFQIAMISAVSVILANQCILEAKS